MKPPFKDRNTDYGPPPDLSPLEVTVGSLQRTVTRLVDEHMRLLDFIAVQRREIDRLRHEVEALKARR